MKCIICKKREDDWAEGKCEECTLNEFTVETVETVLPTLEERIGQIKKLLLEISLRPARAFGILLEYKEKLDEKLELWMIVPTDKDGNVLEEPILKEIEIPIGCDGHNHLFAVRQEERRYNKAMDEYHQAKQRCLFDVENVKLDGKKVWFDFNGKTTWKVLGFAELKHLCRLPLTEAGIEYFNLKK